MGALTLQAAQQPFPRWPQSKTVQDPCLYATKTSKGRTVRPLLGPRPGTEGMDPATRVLHRDACHHSVLPLRLPWACFLNVSP